MKIGFIGFGNMAQAMARGLILKDAIKASEIYCCARNWDKLCANTEPYGFIPCKDIDTLIESVEIVIIAVKPNMVDRVIAPVKAALKNKMVISVVAGYTFEKYENLLEEGTHHISTIPNTPVSIGEGIIICEETHSLSEEELRIFEELFSKIALIKMVETKLLGIGGTICGCAPAFVSMFIEALSDAAVLHGIPRELSYELVSKMVVGTGKMQLDTHTHPGIMKDAVCSPGGTTIVGVATLERKGMRSAVIDAVDAIQSKR
nr:pyrroline-5-carboxylate reductase [uncultured Niameybacter sp.]